MFGVFVLANALYDKGREGFLDGSIDWDTDTISADLLAGYTPDLANHEVKQHVLDTGAVVNASTVLSSKTVTNGVADAANITWTSVTGNESAHIVIYQDTGDATTARLVAMIDTATNLPVEPNGGDITVQWDDGADKIFRL